MRFNLLIILFFACASKVEEEAKISICPVENGTFGPRFYPMFVHRGPDYSVHRVLIKGKLGDEVYAVSDGIIERISPKTGRLLIKNNDLTFTYLYFFCLNPSVKEGKRVKVGDVLGTLEYLEFIRFSIEKNGEIIPVGDYIECQSFKW